MILFVFLRKLRSASTLDSALRVLVVILSIDAFRTLFENLYFGAFFNSMFGLLPGAIKDLLSHPALIFLPKFVNITAACVVLLMLIRKWFPGIDAAHRQRLDTERRHQDVIAAIDGIIWQADAQTLRISLISEAAERVLGYPLERWTSEADFWRQHLHPDDVASVIGQCLAMEPAQPSHELTYRMIAADGSVVWLQAIANVVQESGKPSQFRGACIDVP